MMEVVPYNFIAIEGNIGAGKTTLSGMLARYYNARLILEQFEDNPFLPSFYDDPSRVAFPLELSFLADRYTQLKNNLGSYDLFHKLTISDYYVGKSFIFASANLNEDEMRLYSRIFEIMVSQMPQPDLLIYLYVDYPRLQANIRKRGRTYEQKIPLAYLQKIQKGYLDYLKQSVQLPVLILDMKNIDFVKNEDHFKQICLLLNRSFEKGIHWIEEF